jgi:hypothetical protein
MVAMLRSVLDELLVNQAFTEQNYLSTVDIAERVLRLAAAGEREASVIKKLLLQELLTTRVAA